jgi:hypothetical protein
VQYLGETLGQILISLADDHIIIRRGHLRNLEAVEAAGTRLAVPTQASINYNADVLRAGHGLYPADK